MISLLDRPFVATAVGIAVVSICTGVLTLALAMIRYRRDRVREQRQEHLRAGLFDRLDETDPAWGEWVRSLSRGEQRELRWLLDAYLRRFRGKEYESLCDLARTVGIPAEARQSLTHGGDRFRGLTWLALLGEPVEPSRLRRHCSGDPTLKAGAARTLYVADRADADEIGTDLILGDGTDPMSAFGLDTLYRLNRGGDTPLLEAAESAHDDWEVQVLVQVLTVLRFCQASEPGEAFEWVVPLCDHDSPRVRQAAIGVLQQHGWRSELQEQVDFEALVSDPQLSVRRAAYVALASWGDRDALGWVNWGLVGEQTDRGCLTGVRALAGSGHTDALPSKTYLEPYVEWVEAEQAIGGRRERIEGVAVWS